jgi:hypothetical protein
MPLKFRAPDLSSAHDKTRGDYVACSGDWDVGRIYETPDSPDHLCWFWSMNVNGPMTRSGHMPTLEEAKAQFQKSWDAWKAWAKLEETE